LFKSDDALAAVFLFIQFCLLPPLKALLNPPRFEEEEKEQQQRVVVV